MIIVYEQWAKKTSIANGRSINVYAFNGMNFSYHYDFGSSFLMVAVIAVIVSYSFWV